MSEKKGKEVEQLRIGTADDAFDYEIVIDGVAYPNTFRDDVRLDRTVLEDEFEGQAAKYAYYSTLAALARDQEARLKRDMERVYAQQDAVARKTAQAALVADPKRKFTEKMYESMAKTSEPYQRIQNAYIEAKKLAELCRANTESFAQRKEMLISLGAHARTGASDVRVLGNHVRNNIQKDEPIKEEIVETTTTKTSRRKPKK